MKYILLLAIFVIFQKGNAQHFPFENNPSEWTFQVTHPDLPDTMHSINSWVNFNSPRNLDVISGDTLFNFNHTVNYTVRGFLINCIDLNTGNLIWNHLTYEPSDTLSRRWAHKPKIDAQEVQIPLIVENVPTIPFYQGGSWKKGKTGLLILDRKEGNVKHSVYNKNPSSINLHSPWYNFYHDNITYDLSYGKGEYIYYKFNDKTQYQPIRKSWDVRTCYKIDSSGMLIDSIQTIEEIGANMRVRWIDYTDDDKLLMYLHQEIKDSTNLIIDRKSFVSLLNKYLQTEQSIEVTDYGLNRTFIEDYNEEDQSFLLSSFDTINKRIAYYHTDFDGNTINQYHVDNTLGHYRITRATFYDDNRVLIAAYYNDEVNSGLRLTIMDGNGDSSETVDLVSNKPNKGVYPENFYITKEKDILLNIGNDALSLGSGRAPTRENYWMKFSKELFYPTATKDEKTYIHDLIYPNPSSNYIHVDNIQDAISMSISDASGNNIIELPISHTIDISSLPPGQYFLHRVYSTGILSNKIIKI